MIFRDVQPPACGLVIGAIVSVGINRIYSVQNIFKHIYATYDVQ